MSCVPGVTVCVLALATLQPGTGNTLLLTRLEKDKPPGHCTDPHFPEQGRFPGQGAELGWGRLLVCLWLGDGEMVVTWTSENLDNPISKACESSSLREFDAIQKEQKENSSCTGQARMVDGPARSWDRRMEVCVPSVDGVGPALEYLLSQGSILGLYVRIPVLSGVLFFSCVRLFANFMDYGMPGCSVLYCLPEFAQIHVH